MRGGNAPDVQETNPGTKFLQSNMLIVVDWVVKARSINEEQGKIGEFDPRNRESVVLYTNSIWLRG